MIHWGTQEGGLILSDYGDNAAIGVTDSGIIRYMYDSFSQWSARLYGNPLPVLPNLPV